MPLATPPFFAHRIFHHKKSSGINSTSMDHIPVEFYSQIFISVFYFREIFFRHRFATHSLHSFLCIFITTMVRCEGNPPKLQCQNLTTKFNRNVIYVCTIDFRVLFYTKYSRCKKTGECQRHLVT